jgi:hypothetical protein
VPQAPESGAGECETPARPTLLARYPFCCRLAKPVPSINNVSCGIFSLCCHRRCCCVPVGSRRAEKKNALCLRVCMCARVCEHTKNEGRVHNQDPRITASDWEEAAFGSIDGH